MTDNSNTALIW